MGFSGGGRDTAFYKMQVAGWMAYQIRTALLPTYMNLHDSCQWLGDPQIAHLRVLVCAYDHIAEQFRPWRSLNKNGSACPWVLANRKEQDAAHRAIRAQKNLGGLSNLAL